MDGSFDTAVSAPRTKNILDIEGLLESGAYGHRLEALRAGAEGEILVYPAILVVLLIVEGTTQAASDVHHICLQCHAQEEFSLHLGKLTLCDPRVQRVLGPDSDKFVPIKAQDTQEAQSHMKHPSGLAGHGNRII
jgi:hypothetical protein